MQCSKTKSANKVQQRVLKNGLCPVCVDVKMGCGSSSNSVVQAQDPEPTAETKVANGKGMANGNGESPHDGDDLPTVMLPDTPIKPKPPIAFEIPLEEFDGAKRSSSPPPHLQRLLQPVTADISLPDIEEKLAVAEQRRQTILQQRAASAQKRTLKMLKSATERLNTEIEHPDTNKHGTNALTIPPEPGVCEDKNIA